MQGFIEDKSLEPGTPAGFVPDPSAATSQGGPAPAGIPEPPPVVRPGPVRDLAKLLRMGNLPEWDQLTPEQQGQVYGKIRGLTSELNPASVNTALRLSKPQVFNGPTDIDEETRGWLQGIQNNEPAPVHPWYDPRRYAEEAARNLGVTIPHGTEEGATLKDVGAVLKTFLVPSLASVPDPDREAVLSAGKDILQGFYKGPWRHIQSLAKSAQVTATPSGEVMVSFPGKTTGQVATDAFGSIPLIGESIVGLGHNILQGNIPEAIVDSAMLWLMVKGKGGRVKVGDEGAPSVAAEPAPGPPPVPPRLALPPAPGVKVDVGTTPITAEISPLPEPLKLLQGATEKEVLTRTKIGGEPVQGEFADVSLTSGGYGKGPSTGYKLAKTIVSPEGETIHALEPIEPGYPPPKGQMTLPLNFSDAAAMPFERIERIKQLGVDARDFPNAEEAINAARESGIRQFVIQREGRGFNVEVDGKVEPALGPYDTIGEAEAAAGNAFLTGHPDFSAPAKAYRVTGSPRTAKLLVDPKLAAEKGLPVINPGETLPDVLLKPGAEKLAGQAIIDMTQGARHLINLRDLRRSPEYRMMDPELQSRVETAVDQLESQIPDDVIEQASKLPSDWIDRVGPADKISVKPGKAGKGFSDFARAISREAASGREAGEIAERGANRRDLGLADPFKVSPQKADPAVPVDTTRPQPVFPGGLKASDPAYGSSNFGVSPKEMAQVRARWQQGRAGERGVIVWHGKERTFIPNEIPPTEEQLAAQQKARYEALISHEAGVASGRIKLSKEQLEARAAAAQEEEEVPRGTPPAATGGGPPPLPPSLGGKPPTIGEPAPQPGTPAAQPGVLGGKYSPERGAATLPQDLADLIKMGAFHAEALMRASAGRVPGFGQWRRSLFEELTPDERKFLNNSQLKTLYANSLRLATPPGLLPNPGEATVMGKDLSMAGVITSYVRPLNHVLGEHPETVFIESRLTRAENERKMWIAQTERRLEPAMEGLSRFSRSDSIRGQMAAELWDTQEDPASAIGKISPTFKRPYDADMARRASLLHNEFDSIYDELPYGSPKAGGPVGYVNAYMPHLLGRLKADARYSEEARSGIAAGVEQTINYHLDNLTGMIRDFFKEPDLPIPPVVDETGRISRVPLGGGRPSSVFVEARTGQLTNYTMNLRKIIPTYIESIAKVKFDLPAVNEAIAAAERLPDSRLRELATGYIRNFANFESYPEIARIRNRVVASIKRTAARSQLGLNLGLQTLHLARIPLNVFPSMPAKYFAEGVKAAASDPVGAFNEANSLGLVQQNIRPMTFKTNMQVLDTYMQLGGFADATDRSIGYYGFKKQALTDLGLPEREATLYAIEKAKEASINPEASRSIQALDKKQGMIQQLLTQYKEIPFRMVEQMYQIAKNTGNDPAATAKLLGGIAATTGLTYGAGIKAWHLGAILRLGSMASLQEAYYTYKELLRTKDENGMPLSPEQRVARALFRATLFFTPGGLSGYRQYKSGRPSFLEPPEKKEPAP